uniref:Large ribosomal subunit protein uL29m n=1 Tax=Globodera rostochiensis TaxID=31243 RepID=A0A914HPB0_GLORO
MVALLMAAHHFARRAAAVPAQFVLCVPNSCCMQCRLASSNSFRDPMEVRKDNVSKKRKGNEVEEVKRRKKKVYALAEFFDRPENWGKRGTLDPSDRPGRSWTEEELRLKSNSDLHKLWYVLLKERNMLMTMDHAYKVRFLDMPNPERIARVKESMDRLEAIVHERNDAFLRLETGDGATPPKRTVTSFMGFTYDKYASEHYLPSEASGQEKEYEVPMLDEQAHLMQVLWREKEHMKEEMAVMDEYLFMDPQRDERDDLRLIRPKRRNYNRVEDLPQNVVARWRKEREEFQPPDEPQA